VVEVPVAIDEQAPGAGQATCAGKGSGARVGVRVGAGIDIHSVQSLAAGAPCRGIGIASKVVHKAVALQTVDVASMDSSEEVTEAAWRGGRVESRSVNVCECEQAIEEELAAQGRTPGRSFCHCAISIWQCGEVEWAKKGRWHVAHGE
jgi:hypothetical protein